MEFVSDEKLCLFNPHQHRIYEAKATITAKNIAFVGLHCCLTQSKAFLSCHLLLVQCIGSGGLGATVTLPILTTAMLKLCCSWQCCQAIACKRIDLVLVARALPTDLFNAVAHFLAVVLAYNKLSSDLHSVSDIVSMLES